MSNDIQTQLLSKNTLHPLAEPQARQLLALGERNGWMFQYLGQAPIPTNPIRAGNWLLMPAQQDNSRIPTRTYQRIQAIYAQGFRPKGFVVVHEAPMLLSAPKTKETSQIDTRSKTKTYLKVIGTAALGIGALAGAAVALVSVLVIGGVLLLPMAMVAGAILIDPILIAVTEDDHWIEIDRWSITEGKP
jgi:hypothetical protein